MMFTQCIGWLVYSFFLNAPLLGFINLVCIHKYFFTERLIDITTTYLVCFYYYRMLVYKCSIKNIFSVLGFHVFISIVLCLKCKTTVWIRCVHVLRTEYSGQCSYSGRSNTAGDRSTCCSFATHDNWHNSSVFRGLVGY